MIDQLNQLADLHQKGILTDDEFAAAKAKVCGTESWLTDSLTDSVGDVPPGGVNTRNRRPHDGRVCSRARTVTG